MKILNKEYASQMKQLRDENNIELSDHECECYSNMFHVLNDVAGNQFTFEQLFDTYDFFTDVLDGKRPNVDLFTHEDAFKGFYRLSKRYSTTKNLKDRERLLFCFVIYWASCIMIMDEETQEPTWNMGCFERGTKTIVEEYDYEAEQFPDKFIIKSYSDPTKEDYGYTPENPIELTAVAVQYQYLNGIETDDGKKITYKRIGSLEGEDDIFIDQYEIYVKGLLTNKKIATLYLTGDGSYNSISTPKGFRFIKD